MKKTKNLRKTLEKWGRFCPRCCENTNSDFRKTFDINIVFERNV